MARNRRERLYNVYRRNKNVINAISSKKARAEFKALIIKSKNENWEKFTNQINRHTPLRKVYEIIRKINGIRERCKVNTLMENDVYLSSTAAIVNRFAEVFSCISSDQNYSPEFCKVKRTSRD